jgi:hypothetical protein
MVPISTRSPSFGATASIADIEVSILPIWLSNQSCQSFSGG